MNINDRIIAFAKIGDLIKNTDLGDLIRRATYENNWFTESNINLALEAIADKMLNENQLRSWLSDYSNLEGVQPKTVALVLAGNIPAVGWHDILCVLILGHKAQIKLSSKDSVLIKFLIESLITIESSFSDKIDVVERPADFDAIIATGSNNTSMYFKHYFSKYPHIIRSNRKSIAVIFRETSEESIKRIGTDMFTHFGLGCRNVSKLFIHKDIELSDLMEIWHENKEIIMHNKYKNNYDYNYTVSLMNNDNFLMNGAMILREDPSIHSRIATIHYERFEELDTVQKKLIEQEEEIQCVVSEVKIDDVKTVLPGEAQSPSLDDYADNVDTLEFLKNI